MDKDDLKDIAQGIWGTIEYGHSNGVGHLLDFIKEYEQMKKENIDIEAERKEFEQAYNDDRLPLEHSNWCTRDEDGCYILPSVAFAWEGWQWARGFRDG